MSERRKQLAQSLLDSTVPQHLHAGLLRWILDGVPPGEFLRAIVSNALVESVLSADSISIQAIPNLVQWLVSNAPVYSFGESAVLYTWRGLEPLSKEEPFDD